MKIHYYDNCPICGLEFRTQCKCAISDRQCMNGHHWHTCLIHNRMVIGESDHSSNRCTCRSNNISPTYSGLKGIGWFRKFFGNLWKF